MRRRNRDGKEKVFTWAFTRALVHGGICALGDHKRLDRRLTMNILEKHGLWLVVIGSALLPHVDIFPLWISGTILMVGSLVFLLSGENR